MKKNLKKLYSIFICLAIITATVTALPANAIAATTVSFADKIIFENDVLGETSTYGLNNTGTEQEEPESLSVTLRFEESFSCDCGEITSDEELSFHRNELKEYYKGLNERRIDALNLEDSSDISYSYYGPFIEYVYEDYNSFTADDYDTLANKNPSDMTHVYIRNNYRVEDNATIGTETRPEYDFTDALADVGITNKTKHGSGIKIGILESKVPDNHSHLNSITYYEYYDPADENIIDPYNTSESMARGSHSFYTSAILGGNYGIADDATLYFASLNGYSALDCLNWFLDNDVNVINRSNGIKNGLYDSLAAFFDYFVAYTKTTIVCSAGNQRNDSSNQNLLLSPSTGANIICVASNDSDKKVSSFSSYLMTNYWESQNCLLKPTLTAPGGSITNIANSNAIKSGTSFAAPFVTGIVSLLMEEFPSLKYAPDEIMTVLTSSCTPVLGQTMEVDQDAGFGIVNYTYARQAYENCSSFVLGGSFSYGSTITSLTFTALPSTKTTITATVLYNSTTNSPSSTTVSAPDVSYVCMEIYDYLGNLVNMSTTIGNICYTSITNYSGYNSYTVYLYYYDTSSPTSFEWCAISHATIPIP